MSFKPQPVTSALLSSHSSVAHAFFTREGGVSDGLYNSLNCGLGTEDSSEHLYENRSRVTDYFGLPYDALVTLSQVHENEVVTITDPEQALQMNGMKADALVTNVPNILLGILTADCGPVLLADAEAGVVGAAHAGWKGAMEGVTHSVIEAMCRLGAIPDRITASIGPTIAQPSYEVDSQFHNLFIAESGSNTGCFTIGQRENHYHFDLPFYIRKKLEKDGIERIDNLRHDTYAEETRFFSYRRATHRSELDYGRQISVIGLKK